ALLVLALLLPRQLQISSALNLPTNFIPKPTVSLSKILIGKFPFLYSFTIDISQNIFRVRLIQMCMILMGILLFSCDNDDYPHAAIPSVVLNEFWSHFPKASDVEFTKTGDDYMVDFEWNGNDAGVVIAPAGVVIKEKMEISFEELPARVKQ